MSIKSFSDFLVEETKEVTFVFGRFNPPTTGHEKLFETLKKVSRGNPYRVYASQSSDPKKNPLQFKDKVKFLRKMFPKHARNIMADTGVRNVLDIAVKLYDQGFTKISMVAGSDRIKEFELLLNKYNGVDSRHGFYQFEGVIKVVSAGERDPDSDDVSGMSASKLRAAAQSNDLETFAKGMPRGFKEVTDLFNAVRKGMGLKESHNYRKHIQLEPISEAREEYIEGNLFQVGDIVRLKESNEEGKIIVCGTNYVMVKFGDTRKRCWLESVELVEAKFDVHVDDMRDYGDEPHPDDIKHFKMAIKKHRGKVTGSTDKGVIVTFTNMRDAEQFKHTMKRVPKHTMFSEEHGAGDFGTPELTAKYKSDTPGQEGFTLFLKRKKIEEEEKDKLTKAEKEKRAKERKDLSEPGKLRSDFGKGLSKSTKAKRQAQFNKQAKKHWDDPSAYKPAPGDKSTETKPSQYTKKYKQLYGENFTFEDYIVEDEGQIRKAIQKKSDASGIQYSILKQVFDRGVAAWRVGHKPGTTPAQWGLARVNSFIVKGKTWQVHDSDLAKKVK